MILLGYSIDDIKKYDMKLVDMREGVEEEKGTIRGIFSPEKKVMLKCSSCHKVKKIFLFQAIKMISVKEFTDEIINEDNDFKQYYNQFLALCESCAVARHI